MGSQKPAAIRDTGPVLYLYFQESGAPILRLNIMLPPDAAIERGDFPMISPGRLCLP